MRLTVKHRSHGHHFLLVTIFHGQINNDRRMYGPTIVRGTETLNLSCSLSPPSLLRFSIAATCFSSTTATHFFFIAAAGSCFIVCPLSVLEAPLPPQNLFAATCSSHATTCFSSAATTRSSLFVRPLLVRVFHYNKIFCHYYTLLFPHHPKILPHYTSSSCTTCSSTTAHSSNSVLIFYVFKCNSRICN